MKTNMQSILGLCIALCLGLTSACVRVDVSVPSSSINPLTIPSLPLPPEKPPIIIEELKKRHAVHRPVCSSVSLNINGEKQQTAGWCWAATTRTVMEYHNEKERKPTNLQCNIVNKIFWGRLDGTNCCRIRGTSDFVDAPTNDFVDVPLNCVRGGWPYWVFDAYQFSYEVVESALDWKTLTDEICSTQSPFIHVTEGKGGGRHAYIVMGYSTAAPKGVINPSPLQQYVRIYDPTPITTQRNSAEGDYLDIPFEEYVGDASADQNSHYGYFHYRDYVQISPKR